MAWAAAHGLAAVGLPQGAAFSGAAVACALFAARQPTRWRRGVVAGGFPLSLLAAGAALPGWAWLVPLVLLAALYPLRTWRDAPLFPTPAGALDALPGQVALAPGARVLDAGCGLGHGLRALRRAYPQACIEGVESSRLLAALARAWCRFATVRRADMWAAAWTGFDLVYLFQRPETMPRAIAKADAEMADGAWLASLQFEVPGRRADAVLRTPGGRPLWLYRVRSPGGSSRRGRLR
jgi:SAM-dependent methyltransferase